MFNLLKNVNVITADCLAGVSHRHLSDHLSELVENTLSDLEHSKVRHLFLLWMLLEAKSVTVLPCKI